MSAFRPKADIAEYEGHVRFVPKADIARRRFEITLVTGKLPRTHAVQG
jgi:hypothetical protein